MAITVVSQYSSIAGPCQEKPNGLIKIGTYANLRITSYFARDNILGNFRSEIEFANSRLDTKRLCEILNLKLDYTRPSSLPYPFYRMGHDHGLFSLEEKRGLYLQTSVLKRTQDTVAASNSHASSLQLLLEIIFPNEDGKYTFGEKILE
ncbi:hypothetical protein HYV86_00635 [Candidatus Woesearchaeota archaeon]|nr:hypothetical protein [Candidatus Woesearchaeota archaeon]